MKDETEFTDEELQTLKDLEGESQSADDEFALVMMNGGEQTEVGKLTVQQLVRVIRDAVGSVLQPIGSGEGDWLGAPGNPRLKDLDGESDIIRELKKEGRALEDEIRGILHKVDEQVKKERGALDDIMNVNESTTKRMKLLAGLTPHHPSRD
tara:strand:- start:1370 stop:1825 length:456 start_codon:yes stop_codon:yes gene_type:complete